MSPQWRWLITGGLFVVISFLWVGLAWDGDHFALIALGLTTVFLAVGCAFFGWHWSTSLQGWERSNDAWEATQKWGLHQDQILRDALNDLEEHDSEAAAIHSGRSIAASGKYIAAMDTEGVVNAVKERPDSGI